MIDPTAIIQNGAQIGNNVEIGPFVIVEENVKIGDGCVIESSAVIRGRTTIGKNNKISSFAVLGVQSQDLKDKNEPTELIIGNSNTIREFATIHLSTNLNSPTKIGDNCLIMSYAHIAHDCQIGNNVILANAVNLAGYVKIDDFAIIGGLSAVNQFTKIGTHSFVGGCSAVKKDIAPFTRGTGNPYKTVGINSVGLSRKGFSNLRISQIKKFFKDFYYSQKTFTQSIALAEKNPDLTSDQKVFLDFAKNSERGLSK